MFKRMQPIMVAAALAALGLTGSPTFGQAQPDSAALIAAERDAMSQLAYMDGRHELARRRDGQPEITQSFAM